MNVKEVEEWLKREARQSATHLIHGFEPHQSEGPILAWLGYQCPHKKTFVVNFFNKKKQLLHFEKTSSFNVTTRGQRMLYTGKVLRNPGQTSPEVQNSGPTKGLMSSKILAKQHHQNKLKNEGWQK